MARLRDFEDIAASKSSQSVRGATRTNGVLVNDEGVNESTEEFALPE
ncbi:hypothetical protein [Haladaptatus cibarius]|nr:hypothetical protein [Haladaptatus cibarius]